MGETRGCVCVPMPVVDANHLCTKKKKKNSSFSITYITNDRCDCEIVAYVRWISGASFFSTYLVSLYDDFSFIHIPIYTYIYTYIIIEITDSYLLFASFNSARRAESKRKLNCRMSFYFRSTKDKFARGTHENAWWKYNESFEIVFTFPPVSILYFCKELASRFFIVPRKWQTRERTRRGINLVSYIHTRGSHIYSFYNTKDTFVEQSKMMMRDWIAKI